MIVLSGQKRSQSLTLPLKKGKRNKPFEPEFAIVEERF
jgi:hypothetical protein